jgi:hypothetical protein
MSSSRLAFVQDFEYQLASPILGRWFDALRHRNTALLREFPDPSALRCFLQAPEPADSRKPEIWQAMVRRLQVDRTPEAVTFLLGLLEPALGALVDGFARHDLDAEDLWQEALTCALEALANPKLAGREAVLVGLVLDTFKGLCVWLRRELTQTEEEAPLLSDFPYETSFEEVGEGADEEPVLAEWCRRAQVGSMSAELLFATGVEGIRLGRLAPSESRTYDRLQQRRARAEKRLKSWLLRQGKDVASRQKKTRCRKKAEKLAL